MALNKLHDLGTFIRDQRRTARLSLRKVSQMAGISNPYLSQIERGLRRPSADILQSIAKALRVSAETMYVKAGILEERSDAPDPVAALLSDHTITEKQRQVLLEIYQSFRHENELENGAANARAPKRAKSPAANTKKSTQPKTAARAKKASSSA